MIEFKQIIGRGTRLFDGKDYFTIYDFVKAHHHFNDPVWDGEPIEPEIPKERKPKEYTPETTESPVVEESEPTAKMVKIKLADGKVRELRSGFVCIGNFKARGNKKTEEKMPQLENDITHFK